MPMWIPMFLGVPRIVGLVLNGRGQNTACVKDTSELLRRCWGHSESEVEPGILKQIIIQRTSEVSEKLQDEIAMVHRSIQSMREEQMEGVSAFSRFATLLRRVPRVFFHAKTKTEGLDEEDGSRPPNTEVDAIMLSCDEANFLCEAIDETRFVVRAISSSSCAALSTALQRRRMCFHPLAIYATIAARQREAIKNLLGKKVPFCPVLRGAIINSWTASRFNGTPSEEILKVCSDRLAEAESMEAPEE
eukprot:g19796.t1